MVLGDDPVTSRKVRNSSIGPIGRQSSPSTSHIGRPEPGLRAFCTRIPAPDGVSSLEFVRTRLARPSRALRPLEHIPRIPFESEHTFYDTAANSRVQAESALTHNSCYGRRI